MPEHRRRPGIAVLFALFAGCLNLSACAGDPPATVAVSAAQPPAQLQVGALTVSASTLPTAQLGAAAASQYGIARGDDDALLLVGLRSGPANAETSLSGRVTATATDLLGRRRPIALREVRNGGFIDYVGTVPLSPPETLDFEVVVDADGHPRAVLRFNRDFPRG